MPFIIVCSTVARFGQALQQSGLGLLTLYWAHYNRRPISNTVIGTLVVDGWTVTFGTVRRGLGGL